MHQYAANSEDFTETNKVKLSGTNRILGSESVSLKLIDEQEGLIGICVTGERVVRLWQLENGQNAAVIVAESVDSHWAGVTTLDYCNGVLAAGTRSVLCNTVLYNACHNNNLLHRHLVAATHTQLSGSERRDWNSSGLRK